MTYGPFPQWTFHTYTVGGTRSELLVAVLLSLVASKGFSGVGGNQLKPN